MATLGFDIKADGAGLDDLKKKFDTVIGGMGAGLKVGIGALVGKQLTGKAGEMINNARTVETLSTSYETLIGNARETHKVIAGLQTLGAKTPMSFEELGNAGKLLLQAGVEAKDLNRELTTLGNLASLANVPITDLAAIYLKGANKGKVETEQLNQLSERGIPIVRALAKNYGVAESAIYKMASTGKIQFTDLKKALDSLGGPSGEYANQMLKQSRTGAGLQSTFDDNLKGVRQAFGKNLDELFKPVLEAGIHYFPQLQKGIEATGGAVKSLLTMAVPLALMFALKGAEKITGITSAVKGLTSTLQGSTSAAQATGAGVEKTVGRMGTLWNGVKTRITVATLAAAGMQAAVMGIALATQKVVEKADKMKGLYEGAMDDTGAVSSASKFLSAAKGGNSGIATRSEQASKLKEFDEQIEAKAKQYNELKKESEKGGWFDDKDANAASLKKYKDDLDFLRQAREAARALTKEDLEQSRLARERAEAENKALDITQEKAKEVEKMREEYLKIASEVKAENELGDNLQAQKQYLQSKKNGLMTGYANEDEMEKAAIMSDGPGTGEAQRARAAELYSKLKEIYDLSRQQQKVEAEIKKEEQDKKEILEKLALEYEENVTMAEAEIRGQWAIVDAIKAKNEQARIYKELRKAGMSEEDAKDNASRHVQNVQGVEREGRRKELKDVFDDMDTARIAAKSPQGEAALEVLNRAKELFEKFGRDGMSRDQANNIALKEYGIKNMVQKDLAIGAVSSLRSVGGSAGGVETGIYKTSENQLSELKSIVSLLQAIKENKGGGMTL